MKKNLFSTIFIIVLFASCQKPKDHVVLTGKITHKNSNKITISNQDGYVKEISINDDGTFLDTLKVKEGCYRFFDEKEIGTIYLKNGNKSSFTLDAKAFDQTLKFEGDGADKNNLLISFYILTHKYTTTKDLFGATPEKFEILTDSLDLEFETLKLRYSTVEPGFFESNINLENLKKLYANYFKKTQLEKRENSKLNGKTSAKFLNYKNYNGGTSSLEDFKGKYVYIDVWATWCAPCKEEIPALKKLEKEYHGKNIAFVSISIDDANTSKTIEKAYEKWKAMVSEMNMTGIQLFSDKGWNSEFIKAYNIESIPRFILIDPNGVVINADAPKPSSPWLAEVMDKLKI
jgi:thiol-disulfide isomerase/thioredoxin